MLDTVSLQVAIESVAERCGYDVLYCTEYLDSNGRLRLELQAVENDEQWERRQAETSEQEEV